MIVIPISVQMFRIHCAREAASDAARYAASAASRDTSSCFTLFQEVGLEPRLIKYAAC